jgi:hypothetical protein
VIRPVLRADAHADVLRLEAPGRLTLAAVGDPERRTIEGLVVPYGEPGRTNLGPVAVRAGAVRLPADGRVIGIVGHDRERPVARMTAYEDTPAGLRMRFRVAPTPPGDQLLAEVASGVRDGLSVEMSDLTFDTGSGDITSGLCEFVAFVPVGAYDRARVAAVTASSTTNLPGGDDVARRLTRARFGREFITVGGGGIPAQQPAPAAPAPQQQPAPAPQLTATAQPAPAAPAPQQQPAPAFDYAALAQALIAAQQQQPAPAPQLTATAQPAPAQSAALLLPTSALQTAPPAPAQQASAVRRMAELQAAAATGAGGPELRAQLADITNADLSLFQRPAGAIGEELWSGGGYTRRFVPLFTQRELTSWKFGGWRWVQGPVVDDYAGDKAEVPTNEVSVEPVENTAQRVAGAWDIDRKFRDFGDTAFWTGFYAAQAESYAEKTDEIAATALIAAARDVILDANVPAAYAGSNVAQADILRATAYGQAILEDTPNVRRSADFVLMNPADWLGLMDLTNLDLPAFLSLLGVQPGSFQRHPLVPAGRVILGVRASVSFYELGGGAPIRVEALDVARAGVDSAVYGYVGTLVNRPGGVISVPLAATAG